MSSGLLTRSAKVGGAALTCEADWSASGTPPTETGRRSIAARSVAVPSAGPTRLPNSAATLSIVSNSSGTPSPRTADVKQTGVCSRKGSRSRSCSTTSALRTSPLGTRSHLLTTSARSEEHTSELQSRLHLVCRLLLEKKKKNILLKSKHEIYRLYTISRSYSPHASHNQCI